MHLAGRRVNERSEDNPFDVTDLLRDGTALDNNVSYGGAPLLVQLATLHASDDFTSAEQGGLLTTAEAHGELQGLMCEAVKAAKKAKAAK